MEKLDDSPKAGDDMPIGILMTMLIASMVIVVQVVNGRSSCR